MSAPNLVRFDLLIETLAQHDVRCVVVGGVAVAIHGGDFLTSDLDVAIATDIPNLDHLAEALNRIHPRSRGGRVVHLDRFAFGSAFVTYETDYGTIEFINRFDVPDGFTGLYARSLVIELGATSMRVASLDDLIAMKRHAGRPKDLAHVDVLEAIRSARK